ncbi:hypothetical protein PENTCL1PPCAC_686, partial [Pristionchus entomophagus]
FKIKIRLIMGMFQACLAATARMVVIIHQYYGPIEYVEPPYLIVCSLIREAFLGYFTTDISILALDRLVATDRWSWYVSTV